MWAVVGALLAFAPVASAQSYSVVIGGTKIYANEVITSDTRVTYDGTEPTVRVNVQMSDVQVDLIDEDDTLEVTVTLANATFASSVRGSDMEVATTGTLAGCDIRVREVDDGAAGESEVTFIVEAAGGDCDATGGNIYGLTFTLPDLTGLNHRRNVTVSVKTDAPGGSNWLDSSETGATVIPGSTCPATGGGACTDLSEGVLTARTGSSGADAVPIVTFAPGFTFTGTAGGTSSINLAGGRTAFTWPFQAYVGSVTLGVASASTCVRRDDPPADCVLQADGHPFSVERRGAARGDLEVAVTGDFRAGDLVWLDVDANHAPTGSELLSLDGDGVMRRSFALDDTAGNRAAGEGLANEMDREEGVVSHNVIYRPNGRDALRPGDYRVRSVVDFNTLTDKDPVPASGAHVTSYTTIEDQQYAYAIPPIGAGDQSQVRIKCEVATQCVVYLECDDTQGQPSFAQLGDPIEGRATRTLSSEEISEALGLGADGWQGRLACTVHSTRSIAVQVLTRATNGVLVNNTYVDS